MPLSDDRMPTLMGKYKVPHFDAKGESDHFFTDLGVPTTFLLASFYWDNFIAIGSEEGTGRHARAHAADRQREDGRRRGEGHRRGGVRDLQEGHARRSASASASPANTSPATEMAAAMSKAFGQPVKFNDVPPEVFRSFGFPGADDLGNMFQFYRDFETSATTMRDVARSRALDPDLQNFAQWLEQNGAKIPKD